MDILSARGTPFKLRTHAENAIKGHPGYRVVEIDGQFVGRINDAVLEVVCPECGVSHHSTTEAYTPDKQANPAMIELIEPYKSWGWDELPKDPTMGYGCLVCPGCGAALAPNGKLRVK